MFEGLITFSMVISVLIELAIGYTVFHLIGNLVLIPGKDKILNVTNKKEYEEAKKENVKVRNWLFLIWTIAVIGFNLYRILK